MMSRNTGGSPLRSSVEDSCISRSAFVFDGADVGLVGVTEEDPAVNKRLEGETGIKYPLLSDRNGALAQTYGVFLERWATARRSTFIIDRKGTVRYVQQGAAAADSEQALDLSLKAFVHHSVPVVPAH
jgi:peroxiredoxin